MNLNKLTEKAQEAIVEAQRQAEARHNTQVEPEHMRHLSMNAAHPCLAKPSWRGYARFAA
jgi:hypothetical protein